MPNGGHHCIDYDTVTDAETGQNIAITPFVWTKNGMQVRSSTILSLCPATDETASNLPSLSLVRRAVESSVSQSIPPKASVLSGTTASSTVTTQPAPKWPRSSAQIPPNLPSIPFSPIGSRRRSQSRFNLDTGRSRDVSTISGNTAFSRRKSTLLQMRRASSVQLGPSELKIMSQLINLASTVYPNDRRKLQQAKQIGYLKIRHNTVMRELIQAEMEAELMRQKQLLECKIPRERQELKLEFEKQRKQKQEYLTAVKRDHEVILGRTMIEAGLLW